MSPIRDNSFVVIPRSDSVIWGVSLTAETVSSQFEIDGTDLGGMALELSIPAITGAPIVDVYILASSSTTITSGVTVYEVVGCRRGINAAGEWIIPFSTHKRTVLFDFLVVSDSGCISNPEAWITLNVGQNWTRTTEFR